MIRMTTLVLGAALSALMLSGIGGVANASTPPKLVGEISVPGKPLRSFDISAYDPAVGLYILADRSNRGLDFIGAQQDRFLWRAAGFAGTGAGDGQRSGPNGVAMVGDYQIWAGDGDSSVKIVDLTKKSVVASVSTGGKQRVDELAYDEADKIVLAVNNSDQPAFMTLISASSPYRILARIALPQATDGIEQPVWDPRTDKFLVAVPTLNGDSEHGAVVVIDPKTRQLVATHKVRACEPAGLALGPAQHLLLGCSDDGVKAGLPAKSLLMDAANGNVTATVHKVGGSDEVWYDPADETFYLAAVANPGGPVLGVVDATTGRWEANAKTGPGAHSVAAGGRAGHIFVPVRPNDVRPACKAGCVLVFSVGR